MNNFQFITPQDGYMTKEALLWLNRLERLLKLIEKDGTYNITVQKNTITNIEKVL